MKIGFSTSACPSWPLADILRRAREFGYEGVELSAVEGRVLSPSEPALSADPPSLRQQFADAGIELVCLGTPVRLHGPGVRAETAKAEVRAYVDLASRLGCPFVRVFGGTTPPGREVNASLARVVEALRDVAPAAADVNVTLVVENDGDLCGSREMWYVLDAVDHPAVACCWNPCRAMAVRERPTLSVPRLGTRIGLVHVCDARADEQGRPTGVVPLGEGQAELPRLIALLRGIAYDGYVVVDQPGMDVAAPADAALPAAAAFLKAQIETKGEVLAAYKGDKTAPRYAPKPPRPPVRIR